MIVRFLFENAWLLLMVLAAIQFALIVIWSRLRARFWTRLVWAGFAAIPALVALSAAVVTPRERIIEICLTLAALVDEGNVAGIRGHLDDNFRAAGLDPAEFLARVEQALTTYHVDDASLRRFEVAFPDEENAVAMFTAACRVRSTDAIVGQLISRWRLAFRHDGRDWKVKKIETLPSPFSPMRDLRDVLP